MEVAIVFMFLFAVVFGIFYLFYSTRNKERLALIEKGADLNIKNKYDETALIIASSKGHIEIVKLLTGIVVFWEV